MKLCRSAYFVRTTQLLPHPVQDDDSNMAVDMAAATSTSSGGGETDIKVEPTSQVLGVPLMLTNFHTMFDTQIYYRLM